MPSMKMTGMGRAVTEQQLAEIEAAVVQGRRHIERQHAIIAELERKGHHTAQAVNLLQTFREIRAEHEAHRDRLRAELAQQAQSEPEARG
jgi:hypothetical protein